MLFIKKQSAWEFQTSGTVGAGVGLLVAEGGSIYLKDPRGVPVTFRYGGAGGGVAEGIKLPKIGKIQFAIRGKGVAGAVAPSSFYNIGILYILDSFNGSELTRSDLRGPCLFVEAGAGFIAGGNGTAMLLGLSPIWLGANIITPLNSYAVFKLVRSAKAVLLMAGLNAGLIAGGGGAALLGGLY